MAPKVRAGGGTQNELALFVAVSGDLAKALADNRPLPRLEFLVRAEFARATYSAKILAVVRFSLKNVPAPYTGLRDGS
jgi:hypothetical protein